MLATGPMDERYRPTVYWVSPGPYKGQDPGFRRGGANLCDCGSFAALCKWVISMMGGLTSTKPLPLLQKEHRVINKLNFDFTFTFRYSCWYTMDNKIILWHLVSEFKLHIQSKNRNVWSKILLFTNPVMHMNYYRSPKYVNKETPSNFSHQTLE